MKKLLFITGSRGEWGYIRPILRLINKRKDVEYKLLVTNMHLLPRNGNSYKEILDDGFKIDYVVNMSIDGYNHYTHAKSLGICLTSIPDIVYVEKPDWIVLAGDRGEQLMGAITGAYTYTPTAHIQAGELSGNIDGMTRHAIGKLVHLHFAANEDAASRLKKLGEEDFRIFNVGAPQVDEMVQAKFSDLSYIENKYSLNLKNGYFLVALHPVTEESSMAGEQAKILIKTLNEYSLPKIVIMPNNDAGSILVEDEIIKNKIGEYHLFSNLKREDYLGLLMNAKCLIGNSSSGLLEAPTFKVPAVNIGRRQDMRFRGINVIDTDFNIENIKLAINKAVSNEFKLFLNEKCVNPYGDGHSSERILDILLNTKIDDKWLIKKLTY
ncbi:MAG: UDP-N-acetylglucosamine 2-epimerase (hydrolyzing) [Lachnospiraceae bacterium]|nr:UDP-N-acetylglucosamine 2-epimerase (hydrolyzing) [Lachnospiraceae bacterium]